MNTFYDAEQKIWHGPHVREEYGLEASIGALVLQKLLQDPAHISQICFPKGNKYTNLEIAQWAVSVAEHFKGLNAQQCDVVGVCAANTDYLAPLVFGALLAGLTLNTSHTFLDEDEVKHIFSITKPKYMFCDGDMYDKMKRSLKEINLDIPIYTMRDHKEGVSTIHEFLKSHVDPTTYRSLLSSDILYSFHGLYWFRGLWCLIYGTIKGATRVISDRSYSPEDFFDIVQKHKVTYFLTAPSMIAMALILPKLKHSDLSSIRICSVGGAHFSPSIMAKFKPHIPNAKLISLYGLTEAGGKISSGYSCFDGSVGKVASNIAIKIINKDGQHLGPLEIGEICVNTIYPWAGYYGNEETTKTTYIDGWIHSGDIGYFNEEGKLFISGRIKNNLRYKGFQFFPNEIEECIYQLPGVAEVCVCGMPDILSMHLPAAAIVRSADGGNLTKKDVYDHVANNMADYKHLRGGVYFLDSLPKTFSGKILLRIVLQTLENSKEYIGALDKYD